MSRSLPSEAFLRIRDKFDRGYGPNFEDSGRARASCGRNTGGKASGSVVMSKYEFGTSLCYTCLRQKLQTNIIVIKE